MIISVDIWGGQDGRFNHVARYVLNIDEALQLPGGNCQMGTL